MEPKKVRVGKNDTAVIDLPPITPPIGGSTGPMRMDFPAAMRQLMYGKKLTRLEWQNLANYVEISDDFLVIHKENDPQPHAILLRVADIFADDWTIVTDHA